MPSARSVAGGSISRTIRVEADGGPLFVKLDAGAALDRLEAEADGLDALRRTAQVAVPGVRSVGACSGYAYLVLEWVEFAASTAASDARLGRALARLHRHSGRSFGWHRDNFIGATAQPNRPEPSWARFFRERRLAPQLELAARNGLGARSVEAGNRLLERVDGLLAGHRVVPSLVHGDLWNGNRALGVDGAPYLFDPAVYYGDRETDIAMTRLFGGFDAAFYAAYAQEWPLPAGWKARAPLYDLYHVLNHFNLFGGGYEARVRELLRQLEAT